MIQIATVGDTHEVVRTALYKILPEKLYILHTENERTKNDFDNEIESATKSKNKDLVSRLKIKQYEDNAKKLKKEIEKDFKIQVELRLVHKYDSDVVINTILGIISNEQQLQNQDSKNFVINITGGTKAMVAGASCAAYLAQTKIFYVLHPDEARGLELVRELPVPPRSQNSKSGDSVKTTEIVLTSIYTLGRSCTNKDLLEFLDRNNIQFPVTTLNKKTGQSKIVEKKFYGQILNYHLNALETKKCITRERVADYNKDKTKKVMKTHIFLTDTGQYYAKFPEILIQLF